MRPHDKQIVAVIKIFGFVGGIILVTILLVVLWIRA